MASAWLAVRPRSGQSPPFHRFPGTPCYSRTAALYACFSLVIAAAVGVAAGVLLPCPGLARGCLGALLAFILLAWAAVAASTAGLKLGSDG